MKKYLFSTLAACGLICFFPLTGTALETVHLSLHQCETDALAASPQLKQLQAQTEAAQSTYRASRSGYYPSLTLDAQGSWVSEIPSLTIGPQTMEFGDNWGYSVGPTVNYVLFDAGARKGQSQSAYAALQAKEEELAFARKQILLQVRQAYFTVQNDLETLYFVNGQLGVARKQLADIASSFDAGAKSRLDVYMAQKQLSQAQADMSAARGALGMHLRELFRLTGTDYGISPRYPLDARLAQAHMEEETSALIAADPLPNTLQYFAPYAQLSFDENSPRLAALESMSQYYSHLAESYRAGLYPHLAIGGGAYFEYPNGPIKEHIFVGKAAAGLSVPLFEGGKSRQQAQAQRHSSRAAQYEKQDVQQTLEKLFYSAQDGLYTLAIEEKFTRQMIADAQKTAALTYQAYQAGAATFFDVDRANLDLLHSQLALAALQNRQLNQLAVMDSLGKESL